MVSELSFFYLTKLVMDLVVIEADAIHGGRPYQPRPDSIATGTIGSTGIVFVEIVMTERPEFDVEHIDATRIGAHPEITSMQGHEHFVDTTNCCTFLRWHIVGESPCLYRQSVESPSSGSYPDVAITVSTESADDVSVPPNYAPLKRANDLPAFGAT